MDFHVMKRKKLQALCKKHGIPAYLKNIEMANRLATLFQEDQTSPVRYKTMSDILSRCSGIKSQRDGASVDDGTLVTSEYNTENSTVEEEELLSRFMSVSNPESELGMATEMELLSASRHGDNTESSSAVSSALDESAVFTTPERNLMMMEQLSQNGKTCVADSVNHHGNEAVESPSVVFTTQEQVLLLGDSVLDEVGKQVDCDANITAKSHDMSDLLAASESKSLMGDFEPYKAGKQEQEEVEFKDESAFFTRLETCLPLGESAHDILGNNMSGSSPHESSVKVIVKDNSVVRGSHISALGLGEISIAESSGSITSKVSYSHEGADYMSKGSQAVGLDVTQGTSKQIKRNSPRVDSENLFDLDTETADTVMDAERNVSFSSYVLAGTCFLVPDESSPFTYIHDQINDALEELVITGSSEEDDVRETKVTTQRDDKGILMLDSSGASSVSGKEDDHLGL